MANAGIVVLSILILALVVTGVWYFSQVSPQETAVMENSPGEQLNQDEENNQAEQTSYIDVPPEIAKELMDTNPELVVIDVSPNYDQGHLPGTVSYPVGDGSLDEAIPDLDKNNEYLVYCRTDSASMEGAQKLIDAGFKKIYRLQGNYGAWVDAGYEIEE